MTTIVEGRLVFKFGPSWNVEKYDEQNVHAKGIQVVQGPVRCANKHCTRRGDNASCPSCHYELGVGTKAVDFVAIRNGDPYLIEVKDFRGYRIENKGRLRDDLAVEVAFKVRDTLAGLLGAVNTDDRTVWEPLVAPMLRRAPKVVLWLERDCGGLEKPGDGARRAAALQDELKRLLRWLTFDVSVKSKDMARDSDDPVVDYLKEGIFELRALMKKQRYVSRGDFCSAWPATPQEAGEKLKKLCDHGFLRPPEGNGDRYTRGPVWDHFHEEPA